MIWAAIIAWFCLSSTGGVHDAQYQALDKFINNNQNAMITTLQGAIQQTDAPTTLEYTLDQASKMGFVVKNIDNIVGYAEYGSGSDYIAVLCHLDTPPVAPGWTVNPYGGVLADSYIFGVGAYGCKGPAYSALWALEAIKSSNLKLNKRVRIIFGTDYGSGQYSDCAAYLQQEAPPQFGFAITGTYPGNYISPTDKNLELMVTTYNTFTKNKLKPIALLPGMYALAIPNVVGFGGALANPVTPSQGRNGGVDERLDIANGYIKTAQLYAREIFELAQ
ncbi:MAG: M20/M25/M40 family metallo-hydrolase [Bacillota bacterium]